MAPRSTVMIDGYFDASLAVVTFGWTFVELSARRLRSAPDVDERRLDLRLAAPCASIVRPVSDVLTATLVVLFDLASLGRLSRRSRRTRSMSRCTAGLE